MRRKLWECWRILETVFNALNELGNTQVWRFEQPTSIRLKHVVRNLNVRPDSSLWHNRDNSVFLGSCESKQGQGGKLGHGGMWKIPWYSYIHEETISPDHHEGSKSATPYDQYAERANNTPPSMANMLNRVITSRLSSFMREQNPPPPMTKMLNGLTTSILSSWGMKIRHLLRTICWLGK